MLATAGYLIVYFAAVKLAKEVTNKVIGARRV